MIRVIIVSLIYLFLAGCEPHNRDPASLKIATWNIYWLTDNGLNIRDADDYTRLGKYATQLDADIVALQEVENAALAAAVLGAEYEYYFSDREGGKGTQRVGVAVRKGRGIAVLQAVPYRELDVGGIRYGMDIVLEFNGQPLRLLAIHLKSGCFDQPLSDSALAAISNTSLLAACEKLKQQLPALEQWVELRATEQTPYMILGDFNRRLELEQNLEYAEDEGLWQALNDPEVSDSRRLYRITENAQPSCWDGRFGQYIDHMLLDRRAWGLYRNNTFSELVYQENDYAGEYKRLSDHCPLSVVLSAG